MSGFTCVEKGHEDYERFCALRKQVEAVLRAANVRPNVAFGVFANVVVGECLQKAESEEEYRTVIDSVKVALQETADRELQGLAEQGLTLPLWHHRKSSRS